MIRSARRLSRALVMALAFLLAASGSGAGAAPEAGPPGPEAVSWQAGPAPGDAPAVSARAAVLMDAATGQVLFAKNASERLPMASTTKIMTALVALERGRLDDVVTVSRAATLVDGSRVYLDAGEQATLRDLLYALLLESGNDAAIAIAEHVGGSVEGFVALMNARARELGAADTLFADPHGLSARGHYTTARDLAAITREALRNPVFAAIVATKEYQMPWPAKNSVRRLYNHNKLLWREGDVTGVKTGYIPESGPCLVVSARRGEQALIAVLLNGPSAAEVYRDARRLLDFGFEHYETRRVVRAGQVVGEEELADGRRLPVQAAADVLVTVPKGAAVQVEREATGAGPLSPPVVAGQPTGQLVVRSQGAELARVGLVAGESVAPPPRPARGWVWAACAAAGWWLLQAWGRWRRRRLRRLRRPLVLAPGRGMR